MGKLRGNHRLPKGGTLEVEASMRATLQQSAIIDRPWKFLD